MKVKDIILEGDVPANPNRLAKDQVAALKGAVSMPGISMNKSNGSPYQQYKFMIATGLSNGKGTGEKMDPAGALAGDPLITCYTEEEFGMIKDAAEMTNAGPINQLSNHKSHEADNINKQSVSRNPGPITVKKSSCNHEPKTVQKISPTRQVGAITKPKSKK